MKTLIGIDIGGTKTAVVYARETDGHEIQIVDKASFATLDVKATIDGIYRLIDELIKRNGLAVSDISAIGISCGGPLDSSRGVIMSPPNLPGWDNIPIVSMLRQRYGAPCAIQNDANACAVAEWKAGAGRGTKNMVFLTFGTGLGAGIIIDGKLYSGTNDNAGEIGHLRLEKFGPVGYGKQGSFEGFASGGGIAQLAQSRLREIFAMGGTVSWCPKEAVGKVTAKLVCTQANKGDALAKEIIETSAEYLGRGLSIVVDVLNPEKIVIGSIYARNIPLFYPKMIEVMKRECLCLSLDVCDIVPAALGEQIGDYAAVSVASSII